MAIWESPPNYTLFEISFIYPFLAGSPPWNQNDKFTLEIPMTNSPLKPNWQLRPPVIIVIIAYYCPSFWPKRNTARFIIKLSLLLPSPSNSLSLSLSLSLSIYYNNNNNIIIMYMNIHSSYQKPTFFQNHPTIITNNNDNNASPKKILTPNPARKILY